MNILINKDIEKEYRDELVQGFSLMEALTFGIAIVLMVGVGAALYFLFGVPISQGIYAGMPFALVAVVAGFRKFQDLSLFQYLKEIVYERRTKVLVNETEDPPALQKFSLKKDRAGKLGLSALHGNRAALIGITAAVVAAIAAAVLLLSPNGGGSEPSVLTDNAEAEGTEESGPADSTEQLLDTGTETASEEAARTEVLSSEGQPVGNSENPGGSSEGTEAQEGFSIEGSTEYSALSGTTEEISTILEAYAQENGIDTDSCEVFYSGILDVDKPEQVTFFVALNDGNGTICEVLYDMDTEEISVRKSEYTEEEIYTEPWNSVPTSSVENGSTAGTGTDAGTTAADEGD